MANRQLFLNNFDTTFIAGVAGTPTTGSPDTELGYGILRIQSAAAALLGTVTGGDFYIFTAYKKSGNVESNYEIMKVLGIDEVAYAVGGECRIRVARAQEGTTAQTYVAGDYVSLRYTKGAANAVLQAGANLSDVSSASTARTNLGLGSLATQSDSSVSITGGTITGTTVSGLTLAAGGTGFTVAGGTTSKTLTVSNTLTLAGTDSSTLDIGAGGTLGSAAFTASSAYEPAITTLTVAKGGTGVGTLTGIAKGNGTSAFTAATAGTDYLAPPSGTSILKANSGGALANAVAGTDYQSPIGTISGVAKGNGANALTAAVAGTDYVAPTGSDGTVTRQMFKDTGFVYYDSSTTNALDYTNGSMQRWAPNTGAQTLSITNWPPSGNLGELLIEGVNLGAATITWPAAALFIKSDGTTSNFAGSGVTLQTSGTDFVFMWTRDAGTTIYVKVIR